MQSLTRFLYLEEKGILCIYIIYVVIYNRAVGKLFFKLYYADNKDKQNKYLTKTISSGSNL